MSTQGSLWAFDQLARRSGIDSGLQTVANGNQNRHPDYAVCAQPDSRPARTRCLLTLQNRDVTKLLLSGGFEITEGAGDTISVKRYYRWINAGNPLDVMTLKAGDVTEAEIERQAREFVDDFFRRVETAHI